MTDVAAVFLPPALLFVARSSYGEGYFAWLAVPTDLSLPAPVTVNQLIGMVFGGLVVFGAGVALAAARFDDQEPIPYLWLRSGAITYATVVGGGALFLASNRWHAWLLIAGGVGAAWIAVTWLLPLHRRRNGENYGQAVDRAWARRQPTPGARVTRLDRRLSKILARLVRALGRTGVFSLAAIIVTAFVAFEFGWMAAGNGTSWVAVDHDDLRKAAPGETWVLLAREPEKLWVASVRGGAAIGKVRAIDPVGATFSSLPATTIHRHVAGE